MEDKNKDFLLPENDFLADEPPLMEEFAESTPELVLTSENFSLIRDTAPAMQNNESENTAETDTPMTGEMPAQAFFAAPDDGDLDATRVYLPVTPTPAPEQEIPMPVEEILSGQEDSAVFEEAVPEQEAFTDPVFTNEIKADEEAISSHDFYPPIPFEEDSTENAFSDESFRMTSDDSDELQDAFPAKATPEAPLNRHARTVSKGRPKRKKGYGLLGIPHILATGVWLAIILVIGITLGRFLWVCAADVLAFGRESNKVSVTITANDTIEDIAEKLHEAGLVRYPQLFKLYADIAVDEGDILPGTFEMDTLYDYHALVIQMGPRSSNRTVIEDVLIPEGYNCRQIFALLEEKGICTVAELEEYAANGEFADFWFLEGVERGDKYCLEGFLFPDTYDFYAHSTPREALGKMLLGFENRFTEEIYAQLPALNERLSNMMRKNGCSEEYIAANQLDLRDLLTVASLIEEETASVKESPTIASVIFNRLTQDQEYERYLGIDATILYALGEHTDSLTQEDLAIDSPYNTRTHAGLVPGPITNPGLDSINAALKFVDTNYYYYVLNPETYMHDFSVTLEEHEKKVEKYRAMTATEGE